MKHRLRQLTRLRNRYLFSLDASFMALAPGVALLMRMESFESFSIFQGPLITYIAATVTLKLAIFNVSGMYSQYWAMASVDELTTLLWATTRAVIAEAALFFLVLLPFGIIGAGFPRSIPFMSGALTCFAVCGLRFGIRLLAAYLNLRGRPAKVKNVLIAGAGVAGAMTAKEIEANRNLGLVVVGFVDDDHIKIGKRIHGIPVLGGLDRIPEFVKKLDVREVIIAMPTAPGRVVRTVVESCRSCDVTSQTIPGLFEIIRGTARVDHFRPVELEDLLRRGAIHTDTKEVARLLHDARILVTGAGGSIGSELCRQISDFHPKELVLLGHGEHSIFQIARELRGVKHAEVVTAVADIRDRDRISQIFRVHRPDVVFHAAAHKHVGLMQCNIPDAITNNVLGTRTLLDACDRFAVGRFVMISSDKAVNPTSIMGVTKRIAELAVEDAAVRSGRAFTTVRFGNVLGSRGSVVPLFKRQIEAGGPVTVTHPEVKRYFMTIPEAVQLVLQAGTMGVGGEVFVLDMGEQIKVVDLARELIRLSGLEEGKDIDIEFTGLIPGEKMNEELFYPGDKVEPTAHEKIVVCRNACRRVVSTPAGEIRTAGGGEMFLPHVDVLLAAARNGDVDGAIKVIYQLVPQFAPVDYSGPTIPLFEQTGVGESQPPRRLKIP